MTRRDIGGTVVDCSMLVLALVVWLVLCFAPPALRDVICRSSPELLAGLSDLPGLSFSWLTMMTAMAAPAALLSRIASHKRNRSEPMAMLPLVLPLVTVSVAGALSEWLFRLAGFVDAGGRFVASAFAPVVLAAAVLMVSRDLFQRQAACRAACCVVMVLLQLAGGATNMVWMAALSAWMALESVVPWRRELAAFGAVTLCFAAGFSLMQGSG